MRSKRLLAWTSSSCLAVALVGCATPAASSSAVPAGSDTVSFFGGLDAGKTDAGKDAASSDATFADAGPDAAPHDTAKSDSAAAPDGLEPADGAELSEDIKPSPDVPSGPVCGDGQCEDPETAKTCAADCPAGPAVCGDGWCQSQAPANESPPSCPFDCDAGAVAILSCLKGSCPAQISACMGAKTCPSALGEATSCLAACGGGSNCDWCTTSLGNEPAASAVAKCGFAACGGATPDGICGDDQCGSKESSQTCPSDCQGGGGPVCGDGACTPPENASQCPADCKPADLCGDGQCQAGETSASCPADCKSAQAMCGDAVCQSNEKIATCPFDCDPAIQPSTACGKQKCGKQSDACFGDATCFKVLSDALACLKKCGGGSSCQTSCAGPVLGNDLAYDLAVCGQAECPPS